MAVSHTMLKIYIFEMSFKITITIANLLISQRLAHRHHRLANHKTHKPSNQSPFQPNVSGTMRTISPNERRAHRSNMPSLWLRQFSWSRRPHNEYGILGRATDWKIETRVQGRVNWPWSAIYPKKYAHGSCFAVLCCGYVLTDLPISIRFTSLALWQSDDCPSASKATLMNKDKYFIWIHYERLHNHNKAKHNKTVCIFLGIYCM